MTRFLQRLGRACAAHPWRTLAAWLAVAAAVGGLVATVGGTPRDDWDTPGVTAQRGIDLLRAHLPGAGNTSALVVVHDVGGRAVPGTVVDELAGRLSRLPHVVTVAPTARSADGDTVTVRVGYDVPTTDLAVFGDVAPLEEAAGPTRAAGLQVELGGDLPDSAAAPIEGRGELIGVVVALLVLVLAVGSVVGAGLPLLSALVGLGVGSGGVLLLAAVTDVSTTAPTVATMVGLGVGIDYALLLVMRHTEFLRAGMPVVEAAGAAVATAGRSVLFAASTVLVSLLGLRLVGMPTYSAFGFATAIVVAAVAAASLTLVPALCRLGGRRLLGRRERRGLPRRRAEHTPLTARWAAVVGRRPVPYAVGAAFVLLLLAVPALEMRTWPQDAGTQPAETTTRRAHDLVAAEIGTGANGPLVVVAPSATVRGPEAVAALAADVADVPGIASVGPAVTSPDGAITVLEALPSFGATDERTPELVAAVRAAVPDGTEVTGTTAYFADLADLLAKRLWLVIGAVVGVSVLLLMMVFRSVVVPLKAAAMNLLSIAAAYGVMTAVFQWGWGAGLLGLESATPISSWVPILMFAILFGLSMDYEVFLLSRVREEWLRTGDSRGSVVHGLAATGRVITAAAAIMVAVFLGFATESDVVVTMIGVGMAVAVTLDATLVRMVLVPATMALLGDRNWWMPAWLDRLLPTIAAEAPESWAPPTGDDARAPAGTDDERELVGAR
jgi:RND superfamily putative drug exporter